MESSDVASLHRHRTVTGAHRGTGAGRAEATSTASAGRWPSSSNLVTAGAPRVRPPLPANQVPPLGPGRPHTRTQAVIADKAHSPHGHRNVPRQEGVTAVTPELVDQVTQRGRRGSRGGRTRASDPWTELGEPGSHGRWTRPTAGDPTRVSGPARPGFPDTCFEAIIARRDPGCRQPSRWSSAAGRWS
jgi:hypothetical protein